MKKTQIAKATTHVFGEGDDKKKGIDVGIGEYAKTLLKIKLSNLNLYHKNPMCKNHNLFIESEYMLNVQTYPGYSKNALLN